MQNLLECCLRSKEQVAEVSACPVARNQTHSVRPANAAVINHMPRHRAFNNLGKCKLDMIFFSGLSGTNTVHRHVQSNVWVEMH